jgi:hypothetical protein
MFIPTLMSRVANHRYNQSHNMNANHRETRVDTINFSPGVHLLAGKLVPVVSPPHHVVQWLIGITHRVSQKTPQEPTNGEKLNDTSIPLELPLALHRRRHKNPSQITGRWARTISFSFQRLQPAPSHLGGGNHQE